MRRGLGCLWVACLCNWCAAGIPDSDGDGVPDFVDVCCDTPVGLAVDRHGRPLGDEDGDCDVDLRDVARLIDNLTGPLQLEGACRVECLSNTDCPCDDFCFRHEGDCDGPGECHVRSGGCPDVYDPVCGCDGRTYSNACDAAAAGVSLDYRGECTCRRNAECRPHEFCQKRPTDCDGEGHCNPRPRECPEIAESICGCDGRTYRNPCAAALAGVNIASDGRCEDERCALPADPGPCDGAFRRFYHDPEAGCIEFVYGGCGGNANNFPTLEACEEKCGRIPVCRQPQDSGPCRAVILRWWHNPETGRCESFIYGGCEGNANNFASKELCEQACPPPDVCDLPIVVGPCDAAIPRWAFNARTGECERFIYGGCGGNRNNFETREKCEGQCAQRDPCDLPIDPGECRAVILRFAYNSVTQDCEPFVYGGCNGNANNFATLEECKKRCDTP